MKTKWHHTQSETCLDFSKSETEDRIAGYFTKNRILTRLETKDYGTVDIVLLFFAEIVDVCCGSNSDAPVIGVFTKNVDRPYSTEKQNRYSNWTDTKLAQLQKYNSSVKFRAKAVLGF